MEDNRHIKSTYSFYNHHVANREGGLSLVLAADTVCVCKEIEQRERILSIYLSRYYQVAKIPHLMGCTCSNVKSPIYYSYASILTSSYEMIVYGKVILITDA